MRIALMGYGRFGRALAALFAEAGASVRALDPSAEVPGDLRASSVADLVAGAETVVIAVPVSRTGEAAAALEPHLGATQLVMDVGSVKLRPVEALSAALGRRVPWVGTHPLFGPVSLALAERPLRAVVCPNPIHPDAAPRARALYERIGCEVVEQDPGAHDRTMASTHALAFFVAKGMLDAGVDPDVACAPPSFQAIARTIEAVRSDAGHLLVTVQKENPFAAEARRRLLEALAGIDRVLGDLEAGGPGPDAAALAVPESGPSPPDLLETRDLIDGLDAEILVLLARRAKLARRAAAAKAKAGRGVHDPAREAALLEARRARASELGLDSDSVREIFESILRFSRRLQAERPLGELG